MAPPPVLGDGDEPLGTGVLGDVGGTAAAGITFSGSVAAGATVHSRLHHAFRGADGDRRRRERDKLGARRRALRREYEQKRELQIAARRKANAAEKADRAAQVAARAAKIKEVEEFAARLKPVMAARMRADEDDIAALLLLDAA